MIFKFVFLALLAISHAQLTCTGVINNGNSPNPITSDVEVPAGASCTIDGVNVTGSVRVMANAGLSTIGKVRVFGMIHGMNCGSLFLTGKLSVSGGVSVNSCNQVDVGPNANVGGLSTTNVESVILQGTAALLSISGDGNLIVSGGSVLGGGVSRQIATGSTTICGGTILGGIKLEQVTGDFNAIASASCAKSDISGTIEIIKGKGDVKIAGAMLLGADLIVQNQEGSVDFKNTQLSDISINSLTGSLVLNGVAIDSDVGIGGVGGSIMVNKVSVDGDFGIIGNPGSVTITKNDFTLEDVLISKNGLVSITNNANFTFTASENTGVTVADNQFISVASITKNNQVSLLRNSFTTLSCADNGQISGSGNSVIFGTGQCANF